MLDSSSSTEDLGKPLRSNHVRMHGCQRPFSSGQVGTWIALILHISLFSCIIAPILELDYNGISSYLVILCIVLCSGLHCTTTSSSDPYVKGRHVQIQDMGISATKEKIFRIIPDSNSSSRFKWCELCEWVIDARSAHCLSCKRCTIGVSHHCWFINNCIGQGN